MFYVKFVFTSTAHVHVSTTILIKQTDYCFGKFNLYCNIVHRRFTIYNMNMLLKTTASLNFWPWLWLCHLMWHELYSHNYTVSPFWLILKSVTCFSSLLPHKSCHAFHEGEMLLIKICWDAF